MKDAEVKVLPLEPPELELEPELELSEGYEKEAEVKVLPAACTVETETPTTAAITKTAATAIPKMFFTEFILFCIYFNNTPTY